MSGLEAEKIQERVHGMTEEQQIVVAQSLPDEILWSVLYEKYLKMQGGMKAVSKVVKG